MKNTHQHPHFNRRSSRSQSGVVLLFALIALLVLMIGAVALVRSFNTTLFNTGNIAFKKDLQNQSERAATLVMTALATNGGLSTPALRSADLQALNYSAVRLTSNEKGIPLALLTDSNVDFVRIGSPSNDILVPDQKVEIRYVIDRMCSAPGDEMTLGAAGCLVASGPEKMDGSSDDPRGRGDRGGATSQLQIVYRLSIRAKGPRNTQAYFQSTFAL
jgi:type IV pilus assembly protein PilX